MLYASYCLCHCLYKQRYARSIRILLQLIHCGQKLTDLALGDSKDDVKRESAHTLAVMSQRFPAIVTETVVPFLLRSIGCGSECCGAMWMLPDCVGLGSMLVSN